MRRIAGALILASGFSCAAPQTVTAGELEFGIIDRRAVDGSVWIVPRMAGSHPGPEPFLAALRWELQPAGSLFRVKSARLAAREVNVDDLLPVTTVRAGEVVPDSLVSSLGGSSTRTFQTGEVVRLLELNAAFKSVRMDLEAVCLRGRGRRPRGRAVFVLSRQVGRQTLDEANGAVSAELEPVGVAQVWRECDPATGEPPFALHPGLSSEAVVERLGPPRAEGREGEEQVLDYGSVRVFLRDGVVSRLAVPALD